MKQIIAIKRLALASIILAYILIVFGGYVASSESGMGCGPEWPLCNGEVIPVMQGETLVEFTHRAIGLLLFILSVGLYVIVLKRNSNGSVRKAANLMMGLLIVQVLAGAVVVVLDLPAIVVTLHLLVAMIYLFTLIWIYRSVTVNPIKPSLSFTKSNKVTTKLNVLIVLVLLTLGLGAFIKHQSYGLACSWLDCRDSWVPSTEPELWQTMHRIVAVITAIYIIFLAFQSFAKAWGGYLQQRLLLASILVLLQLGSGVFAVITNLDIPWAVLHLALATALFMIVADMRALKSSS